MAGLTVNIDETLARQASELYKKLGMSLDTAISMFLEQSVREGRMPFSCHASAVSAVHDAERREKRPDPEARMHEFDHLRSLAHPNDDLRDFDWDSFRKAGGRHES